MRHVTAMFLFAALGACAPEPTPVFIDDDSVDLPDTHPHDLEGFWYEVAHTTTNTLLDGCADNRMAFQISHDVPGSMEATLECRLKNLWYSVSGWVTPDPESDRGMVLELDGRGPAFGPHPLDIVAEGDDWFVVHFPERQWSWVLSRHADVDLAEVEEALYPLIDNGMLTPDHIDPGFELTEHSWED